MLRVLILGALICFCGILPTTSADEARSTTNHHNAADTTTLAATMNAANMIPQPDDTMTATDKVIDSNVAEENKERNYFYHPVDIKKPRVIEQFDRRYLDGSYEFKYVLSNGVARYEKSYWKPVGKGKKLLARKGFYSHPLTTGKYLTVFYTADENGYLQNSAKYTNSMPILPKHLDIPELEFPKKVSTPNVYATTVPYMTTRRTTKRTTTTPRTTTRKPRSTTTVKPIVDPIKFNWIF